MWQITWQYQKMQRRRDYEGGDSEVEGGRKREDTQKYIESGKCFTYLCVVTQVSRLTKKDKVENVPDLKSCSECKKQNHSSHSLIAQTSQCFLT
jgi:hypothetical protein